MTGDPGLKMSATRLRQVGLHRKPPSPLLGSNNSRGNKKENNGGEYSSAITHWLEDRISVRRQSSAVSQTLLKDVGHSCFDNELMLLTVGQASAMTPTRIATRLGCVGGVDLYRISRIKREDQERTERFSTKRDRRSHGRSLPLSEWNLHERV